MDSAMAISVISGGSARLSVRAGATPRLKMFVRRARFQRVLGHLQPPISRALLAPRRRRWSVGVTIASPIVVPPAIMKGAASDVITPWLIRRPRIAHVLRHRLVDDVHAPPAFLG